MMDCEVKEYFSILLEACYVEEISLDVAYRQLRELLERLCRTQTVSYTHLSHLVGSDSQQFDSFTRRQIEMFEKASMESVSYTHLDVYKRQIY